MMSIPVREFDDDSLIIIGQKVTKFEYLHFK